ncbi:MAG: hypothetical protein J5379_04540 [Clostridiales bacterium]|nr:hypothetical protein [Clostridiales bacterium]
MAKSAFKFSAVFVLCLSMLISCCSCSGDGSTSDTKKKPVETESQIENTENEQTDIDQTSNDVSDNSSVSEKNNASEFETHSFENGECIDCRKKWNTCLYENICQICHVTPDGSYQEIDVHVDDGSGPNTNMELVANAEGFMITYTTKEENDIQLSYTLRTHKDPFDDRSPIIFSIDFSLGTHFNTSAQHPDYPQIVLVTSYDCKPEELLKAYETGDIFKGENPFIAYYEDDNDGRLCFIPDSRSNDMTLEEMFAGSTLITQEEFFSIYMENYQLFLSYIDEVLSHLNLDLAGFGIQ